MSNHNIAIFGFLVFIFILSLYLFWVWAVSLGLILYLILVGVASFTPALGFFIPSFYQLSDKQSLLLTYDDGPDPIYTPKILDILKENQIQAVFFCIGKKIQQYPELIQQMQAEGHIIANHTWSHLFSWGFLSARQIEQEIEKTENVIPSSSQWFRPPFGVTNPIISKVLISKQMKVITWSFRTYDTRFSIESIRSKIQRKLNGGDIILMHDTVSFSPELTTFIIQFAKQNKLIFQNPHKLSI